MGNQSDTSARPSRLLCGFCGPVLLVLLVGMTVCNACMYVCIDSFLCPCSFACDDYVFHDDHLLLLLLLFLLPCAICIYIFLYGLMFLAGGKLVSLFLDSPRVEKMMEEEEVKTTRNTTNDDTNNDNAHTQS